MIRKFLLLILTSLIYSQHTFAALTLLKLETISDSEEPFERRIYSYDFDVSSDGTIHYVYAKPVPNENRVQIIYMSKKTGKNWPPENERLILENYGLKTSISTRLLYEEKKQKVHICYIVDRNFVDQDNVTHNQGLVYQTISNGKADPQMNVSSGEFHTEMQLDKYGQALFLREYEDFLTSSGKLREPPFPKALRVQLKTSAKTWTNRDFILDLPEEEDYRMANFYFDTERGRYHVLYGNENAVFLRETYPTTNPPVDTSKTPVFFPPGSGHKLIHAYSDDLITWKTSTVDNSGDISENEFWSDLGIDHDGNPYVFNFRYKTDQQGVQQGSSGRFSRQSNGIWNSVTVAGNTTGASEHRAGGGGQVLQDEHGGFHGIWDNSPDTPIDSLSDKGTIMYRYSPDGKNWDTKQMILPFSGEGRARFKIVGNKLLLSILGDFTDARLIFAEYELPDINENLFEISTQKMFYGSGEEIKIHARLQGSETDKGDLYLIAIGPFDRDGNNNLITLSTTKNYYMDSNFNWQPITDIFDAQPIASDFPMTDFNGLFQSLKANQSEPFTLPSRYMLFSAAFKTGTPLNNLDFLSPLFSYELHVCNQPNCKELVE